MAHSNSSLNCFTNCMAKYEHSYIKHTEPCKPPSPHLTFGVMAHEVLYKAGLLRDEIRDVVADDAYIQVIPSEVLYADLKNAFNINNWQKYFIPIVKQVEQYELDLCKDLDNYCIEREVKLQLTADQLKAMGYNVNQSLVGVIDLLIYNKECAYIIDYKFSDNRKTQDDFDMNSQLPIYALLAHINYDIPLHNIKVGYIDIPKQMFGQPTLLSNGTLSRSKSQNISQELYEKAVIAIHGDDDYYNCKPGGHYYDAWCNFSFNICAYLSMQYLDMEAYQGIIKDILAAATVIDCMKQYNIPFLKKYDSYSCKSCEYVNSCKPWTVLENDFS